MTTRREIITSGLGLAGIIAAGRAPAAFVRSMVAARSAAFARSGGGDPYKDTYLHFDGKCYFSFSRDPNIDVSNVGIDIIADMTALYAGDYYYAVAWDNSIGPTGNNTRALACGFHSDGRTIQNFKQNGNNSYGTFNPPSVTFPELVGNPTRMTLGCGVREVSTDNYECYLSLNGSDISVGPTNNKSAFGTMFSSMRPAIGWSAFRTSVGAISNPSVMDLYSVEIRQNGIAVNRYVPALSSSNTPCLYDEILGVRHDYTAVASGGQITLHGTPKYTGV